MTHRPQAGDRLRRRRAETADIAAPRRPSSSRGWIRWWLPDVPATCCCNASETSRCRTADHNADVSTPIGRSTTNSVLANAISDGRLDTFQMRGIRGFSFANNTHGCDNTNLPLFTDAAVDHAGVLRRRRTPEG